jgi:cytoskeletal protein RodZ
MEGLGEKFTKARVARNLTLDEAARMTKIRPNKLAEIEAEDFSHFPSLAYAKGFVLIYGKFLNVDVSPYLEAFETSEHMTVDGYSYLQDNPAPKPRRTEVVRREPRGGGGKSSLLPLVIGIVVLIAGFTLLKLMMDIRRIKPSARDAQALAQASATATPTANASSNTVVAPRALPADITPVPSAVAANPPALTPEPLTTAASAPPVTATMPTPEPTAAASFAPEPAVPDSDTEVRRAEPVHAEDLAPVPKPSPRAASPSPRPGASRQRTQNATPPVTRSTVPTAPRPSPSRPPGVR